MAGFITPSVPFAERRFIKMKNIPELCNPSKISKVGEERVILPQDLAENCQVGLANESAAFIIDKIDGNNSIEKIAEDFCEIYEINEKDAVDVIFDFVTDLVKEGVCKWKTID